MAALPPFANEPVLELRRSSVRAGLADALARLDASLPLSVPVSIGGDRRTGEALGSHDPGEPERLVAHAAVAGEADVDAAVGAAAEAVPAWAATPAPARAAALIGAAAWMRERRLELAALEGVEAVGLWYTVRWAEYLTFLATTILLPLEIYELSKRLSALKIIGFIINVAVVVYLLYAKRLFGLRGGGRVDEELRRYDMSWESLERATPPFHAATVHAVPASE